MQQTDSFRWSAGAFLIVMAGLVTAPDGACAFTAQAKAVQASVGVTAAPVTTVLADTGPLGGAGGEVFPQLDAREASLLKGTIPSLLTGDVLHATAIGGRDQVASEASLGNLALSVAGNTITADFVMARARAVTGSTGSGTAEVAGLRVNGLPILPTGVSNQQIDLAGGRVLINEQVVSQAGTIVNALHVIVDGVADVVIASAKASP